MKESVHISTPMAELLATSDDPIIVAIRQHCPVFNSMLKSSKCTGCKAKDELQVNLEDLLDNQDIMKLMHLSARTLQTLRTNGTIKYIKLRNKETTSYMQYVSEIKTIYKPLNILPL